MSKKLACVLAFLTAMLPFAANALGLGEIKLHSGLNQTLNADIPIVGAASDELDSLQIQLASRAQFQKVGLDYPSVLSKLQFQVVRRSDGSAYIHITSPNVIREPFLDFLIDATWDNGELLREYTVLLNPPNFESTAKTAPAPAAAPAKPAATPTPVATPAPSATAALVAPQTAQPSTPEATPAPPQPAAAAETPAESVVTTPAPPPPAEAPAPAPLAEAPMGLGGDYGPIRRGETLSAIANKLRPSGVTLNQMMIAIYRANPEVFMHNINRMKAGYVMRVPSLSDIQAITVSEANSEVRSQIQEWREHRGLASQPSGTETAETATPALQLVAPSSAAETQANQVPGAGAGGTGTVAETKPAATGEASTTATETAPPPPLPLPAAASTKAPTQAPVTVENSGLAAVQNQASNLNQQTENKPMPLPAEKPAETKPLAPATSAPAPAKPAPAKPAASGGIVDTLLGALNNLYVLIAIAVVVILILIGVVMKKRRASGGATPKVKPGRISGTSWSEQEEAGADDMTVAVTRTKTRQAKSTKAKAEPAPEPVVEHASEAEPEAGDKTVMVPPPPPQAAAVKLDDSDPVAEADFHMAYGLYDQAADVLKKALQQNPGRREVSMKLLEVYFTAGDATNFVDVARDLRQAMGSSPDKDWENVAIMGRQVAPNESLFAATGTGSSSGTASSVDIALDSGGTDTMVSDLDPLAGAFGEAAPQDVPSQEGTAILSPDDLQSPVAAEPAADNSLEFSLPDLPEAAPAEEAPKTEAAAEGGMEFDLGGINLEPTPSEHPAAAPVSADEPTVATDFGTDSQVEFDKALKDLSDFVNTNVPPQEEQAPADGGLGSGLSLDGDMPSMESSAAPAEDSGASSLSEVGTKLDLARAYIDMGDPDGAKSILGEVMEEGTAQQKQEAQELLKHLG
ncbi:MAG TPA: FimV/HubP family polar landmark protein [Gammaproteobacteria bacterium]|nr:FimV/HubP family polar landmark protein [Gammaproteobacteria bacterium]